MKNKILSLLLILAFFLSVFPAYSIAEAKSVETSKNKVSLEEGEYEEGTVLVTIASPEETSLTREGAASFDRKIRIQETYDLGDADILAKSRQQKNFLSDKTLYVSEVSSNTYSTKELMNKLDRKAYVVSVEPDYIQNLTSLTQDTYSEEQWYLDNGSHFQGSSNGISYRSTMSKTKKGTPIVAVMDTGINYEHEDLAGRMWNNPYLSKGLPGIHGYDFTSNNAYCMDILGHGTHCAGVIAAEADNQKGIAGISNAQLMALKVFDTEGKTRNSDIVEALNYIIQAKQAGANIVAVNCSWGGGTSSYAMSALVHQIGVSGTLFVFAAGNDSVNHDINYYSCPYDLYQGEYAISDNRNFIIITGASDPNDNACSFSDYGKEDVDLFAPGDRILSTYCEDNYFPGIGSKNEAPDQTEHFLTFDSDIECQKLYTDKDLGIPVQAKADLRYTREKDFQEDSNSGSLQWTINLDDSFSFKEKENYLYLDVTDTNPDVTANYYVSLILGDTDIHGRFTWSHVVKKSSGPYGSANNRFYRTNDGRIFFKILGIVSSGRSTETSQYYIDHIGISVQNPDTTQFGQYELMKGTSMAAPMVTGAVALLSEIYPEDSTTNRRNRLLTCVKTAAGVTGKCSTNGVLDLSRMDSYIPPANSSMIPPSFVTSEQKSSTSVTNKKKIKIKKIKIHASKTALKAGKKRKLKVFISPSNATNKKVKWSSSKKKWATVNSKGIVTAKKKGRGHTVKITATARDGSRKKAVFRIRIKK